MKVGDIRMELPTLCSEALIGERGPQKCVVTYIHPDYRFYTVEFTFERGHQWREAFYFEDRDPNGPPLPERFRGRILTGAEQSRGNFHSHWSRLARKDALYR